MNNYERLTLKEVNIIFGNLYDLSRVNQYLCGYRSYNQEYDVVETEDEILIRYSDNYPGSMVVVSATVRRVSEIFTQ